MPKFQIQIEEKITIWERIILDIEADNLEEAKKIAKEKHEDFENDPEYVNWVSEMLFNTIEQLTPEDNGGCPTLEVYVKHDKGRDLVYQNAED